MKIQVEIDGKKYRLPFFHWLAYHNQKKLERIEKKLDTLLKQSGYKSNDYSSDESED